MTSLQQRLNLGLAVSITILMVLIWWLASLSIERISEELVQSRLGHDAEALLASLVVENENQITVQNNQMSDIYDQTFSGHYYVVLVDGKELRSRSLWDEHIDVTALEPGESKVGTLSAPNGQPLLVLESGYHRHSRDITILVAEDLTPLKNSLNRFNQYFAFGSFSVLVILLMLQHVVIRGSFRSLQQVQDELKQLEAGDVERLSEQVPAEVRPLVIEVNRLLKLLNQRLQRSRNSMGNLAHALKHPLNLLMQLSQKEGLKQCDELSNELASNTEQISHLIDRELKRARLSGGGTPGHRFIPSQDLDPLIDVLRRVYHERNLEIFAEVDGSMECLVDRSDMLELLGNLLDNACKWASGQVRCSMTAEEGVLITVEDDGPGASEQEAEILTQRGVRIDESVNGHGLGLSIVKDIVALYDGEIKFMRSEVLGGMCVKVRLSVNTSE